MHRFPPSSMKTYGARTGSHRFRLRPQFVISNAHSPPTERLLLIRDLAVYDRDDAAAHELRDHALNLEGLELVAQTRVDGVGERFRTPRASRAGALKIRGGLRHPVVRRRQQGFERSRAARVDAP